MDLFLRPFIKGPTLARSVSSAMDPLFFPLLVIPPLVLPPPPPPSLLRPTVPQHSASPARLLQLLARNTNPPNVVLIHEFRFSL